MDKKGNSSSRNSNKGANHPKSYQNQNQSNNNALNLKSINAQLHAQINAQLASLQANAAAAVAGGSSLNNNVIANASGNNRLSSSLTSTANSSNNNANSTIAATTTAAQMNTSSSTTTFSPSQLEIAPNPHSLSLLTSAPPLPLSLSFSFSSDIGRKRKKQNSTNLSSSSVASGEKLGKKHQKDQNRSEKVKSDKSTQVGKKKDVGKEKEIKEKVAPEAGISLKSSAKNVAKMSGGVKTNVLVPITSSVVEENLQNIGNKLPALMPLTSNVPEQSSTRPQSRSSVSSANLTQIQSGGVKPNPNILVPITTSASVIEQNVAMPVAQEFQKNAKIKENVLDLIKFGSPAASAKEINANNIVNQNNKVEFAYSISMDPNEEVLRVPVVKKIMCLDPDYTTASNEAVLLVTKAAELFVQRFVHQVVTNDDNLIVKNEKKNIVRYADLAVTVQKHEELAFLRELLPDI